MSSLFKTASKGKGKGNLGNLPAVDVQAAEDDMMLEDGMSSGEDENMEDEVVVARPPKKAKLTEIKANGTDKEDGPKRRKDKVLMLSSRGTTQRMRHLMLDLEALLPHVKKGGLGEMIQHV